MLVNVRQLLRWTSGADSWIPQVKPSVQPTAAEKQAARQNKQATLRSSPRKKPQAMAAAKAKKKEKLKESKKLPVKQTEITKVPVPGSKKDSKKKEKKPASSVQVESSSFDDKVRLPIPYVISFNI